MKTDSKRIREEFQAKREKLYTVGDFLTIKNEELEHDRKVLGEARERLNSYREELRQTQRGKEFLRKYNDYIRESKIANQKYENARLVGDTTVMGKSMSWVEFLEENFFSYVSEEQLDEELRQLKILQTAFERAKEVFHATDSEKSRLASLKKRQEREVDFLTGRVTKDYFNKAYGIIV